MAALLERLGGIPATRVLLVPTPGTATESDVLALHGRSRRRCELVDGVLVEKVMGFEESVVALWLGHFLLTFLQAHDLGQAVGSDGFVRLFPGLVRIPDVAFVSWDRFPKGEIAPIPELAPDLVVEILSKGNTKREMDRKLRDYFAAGVRLVWYADPRKQTVRVYTSPARSSLLRRDDTLDGGDVLPGFRLDLRTWFDEASRKGPRRG